MANFDKILTIPEIRKKILKVIGTYIDEIKNSEKNRDALRMSVFQYPDEFNRAVSSYNKKIEKIKKTIDNLVSIKQKPLLAVLWNHGVLNINTDRYNDFNISFKIQRNFFKFDECHVDIFQALREYTNYKILSFLNNDWVLVEYEITDAARGLTEGHPSDLLV
jgi:hypothetical protein